MTSIARYCEQCGQPLGADVRFCGRCGRPVMGDVPVKGDRQIMGDLPVAPTVQPADGPAEIVLGVIPGAARSKGFLGLGRTAFVIVVTSHRLIIATQTNEMMKENIRRARDEAKAAGKGFFGQWGSQMGANFGRHYLTLPPQQILAEHPENTFILPSQLKEVRIQEEGDDDSPTTYKLRLKTHAEKIEFTFQWLDERAARQLLEQLLGAGVRIR